jgi:hypothetical protein
MLHISDRNGGNHKKSSRQWALEIRRRFQNNSTLFQLAETSALLAD